LDRHSASPFGFFLSYRALAALRAISFLLSGESFSAWAFALTRSELPQRYGCWILLFGHAVTLACAGSANRILVQKSRLHQNYPSKLNFGARPVQG
jgi:hypothetical protein